MKLKAIIFAGWVCLMVGAVHAAEQRGDLILKKIPIYEFEDARKLACTALYDVRYGRDVADMREFPYFLCQGRYEMTLMGEKGRAVTLYAQFNYGKSNGFLVVRKRDDRPVWISDLENFATGRWTTVQANHQTGGYEAFYRKGSGFDQNISSLKWGSWWQGETPK
ncbi:MAG: hypothetical protein OEZ51_11025 [Nitrospinota bacterium]|nr:hypothetical protein [Nitrospinota bacterium]